MTELPLAAAGDLDAAAIRAVAAGAVPRPAAALLDRVAERRREVLAELEQAGPVYGVSTGMGAQGGVVLDRQARAEHSERLLLGRCVGGPPWLEPAEVRALLAVRLRDFLELDAGVSAELCGWLVTLLEHDDRLPRVPRDATASAGEIVPLAHAFVHLARPEGLGSLRPPRLGAKEGVALVQGRPMATALALLRAEEAAALARQWLVPAAAELALVSAPPGPYRPELARGDEQLARVLAGLRTLRGPVAEVRQAQVPVSLRVVGPVLATLLRAADRVDRVAGRSLEAVTDSPAYLPGEEPAFASTAGFHAVDLALALDGLRVALVHAAQNGVARLHRMLDPRLTGLPAQLADRPGGAGLVVLHKQVAGEVLEVAGEAPALLRNADTALGQEDVQSSAPGAAEQVRRALAVARRVAAAELLAAHQAGLLSAGPIGGPGLAAPLARVGTLVSGGAEDRPRGEELASVASLLSSGAVEPSFPAAPTTGE